MLCQGNKNQQEQSWSVLSRSWWSDQGGRQAGTRQIGTKIHKLQISVSDEENIPSAERFAFPCCLELFICGKKWWCCLSLKAFPVLSFRRSYSEYVQPSRLRERPDDRHVFHGNYYASYWGNWLLKEELSSCRLKGVGHVLSTLPGHCWLSIMAGCGPSLKGLVHFVSRWGVQVITASLGTAFCFHPAFHHLSLESYWTGTFIFNSIASTRLEQCLWKVGLCSKAQAIDPTPSLKATSCCPQY